MRDGFSTLRASRKCAVPDARRQGPDGRESQRTAPCATSTAHAECRAEGKWRHLPLDQRRRLRAGASTRPRAGQQLVEPAPAMILHARMTSARLMNGRSRSQPSTPSRMAMHLEFAEFVLDANAPARCGARARVGSDARLSLSRASSLCTGPCTRARERRAYRDKRAAEPPTEVASRRRARRADRLRARRHHGRVEAATSARSCRARPLRGCGRRCRRSGRSATRARWRERLRGESRAAGNEPFLQCVAWRCIDRPRSSSLCSVVG